jgi:tRNA A37 threonylcarbamoyladenosine modification protein TsaB
MKIISYDGSMQEKSSMSVLLENDIKTEIIEHGKKTRPSWEIFFKKLYLRHEDLSNIDLFLVCTGPGSSYTAVRSSVSFFKALCTGLNKPLAGISCDELRDFRQKNKGNDRANSIEMINLVKLSVYDYLDSAPSSVNPIHDEEHSFREMNV